MIVLGILFSVVTDADDDRQFPPAGVRMKMDRAEPGFTLIHTIYKGETFLIDLDGSPVHTWTSDYAAASSAYLLDDGSLLRATLLVPPSEDVHGRGKAGRLERISWEGELLWEFQLSNGDELSHHDFEPLPNGNVLVTVWDLKTRDEAIAAGRDPATVNEAGLLSESIQEIEPLGNKEGRIVWEWNAWDHLIQDFDPDKANAGDPADDPGRIDVNIIGYTGGSNADWLHVNSVDYNLRLDQIMLSSPVAHELWIIDHDISTEQAAGTPGDLLYRWGNPSVWLGDSAPIQRLHFQHDAHWIPEGLPGAGHILVFNNGITDSPRNYSTVDELTPPLMKDGTYARHDEAAYPPQSLAWQYGGPRAHFFANRISGAQRLPGGNTLICIGPLARIIEVDPQGWLVWEFFNGSNALRPIGEKPPYRSSIPVEDGGPLGGGGPMFRAHRYSPNHPALAVRLKNLGKTNGSE